MRTINFGILGAGYIAEKFCNSAKKIANAKIVAVASKSMQRASEFAQRNNIENFYDSYEEMLSDSTIDVIYVATTHNFHTENIMLCLDYNKHILCEKSMVLTKADAIKIFTKAKEKNLFVMEAMCTRFIPTAIKAKEWVDTGKIGTPLLSNVSVGFRAKQDMESRIFNKALGGGAMYDIGVYAIEGITYFLGTNISNLHSMVTYAPTGADETANISFKLDDCLVNIQSTLMAQTDPTCYIYGTEGHIKFSSLILFEECTLFDKDNNEVEKITSNREDRLMYQIDEVVKCINNNLIESPIMPAKDTILCCEIFDACLN